MKLLENLKNNLDSEKSYNNYIVRINKLVETVNKPIEYIVDHPKEVYPIIKEKYPNINTRKNMITPILTLFRLNTELDKENKDQWKKYHDDMSLIQSVRIKKNIMPEKVKDKYTSFEEIELKLKELKEEDPHRNIRLSQKYLLLTILTDIKPKRSDLGAVKIYKDKDPSKKDENYIVLRDKISESSYIVMNIYKTKKFYGRVEEDLNKETVKVLKDSLRRYPRNYLFIDKNMGPFKTNDSYGKFVISTFNEFFGKKTGTSLFRHIYVIEKDRPDATEEELEENSRLMLHSTNVHRNYKWVDRGTMTCICKPK